ncbi:MAG: hypothetical protein HDS78_07675 [Bacteroidales bacterium]|nr:hypothetical protein [Bacteroidales bacterium]
MSKIPTYTSVRLREYLSRYSWLSFAALLLIGAAWIFGEPRMALAAVLVCFGLFLFVWTRVWVGLCSVPASPLWSMTPTWHPMPAPGVLLSVSFTAEDREPQQLTIRQADIDRTEDRGAYLLLYLKSEPGLLIVPCDDITPELRNKLLE